MDGCKEYHNSLLHKPNFPNVPTSSDVSSDAKMEAELTGMTSSVEIMNTQYRSLPVTLYNPINGILFQTGISCRR